MASDHVDLGLITLVRAHAVITTGELITKRVALDQLHEFGVPAELVHHIRCRRRGEPVELTGPQRQAQAELARQLMLDGIPTVVG